MGASIKEATYQSLFLAATGISRMVKGAFPEVHFEPTGHSYIKRLLDHRIQPSFLEHF